MVYARTRSMNASLGEGMTDGKYKKVVNHRDQAESTTQMSREDLKDVWFGIHEEQAKVRPDGKVVRTPNFESTRPAEPTV